MNKSQIAKKFRELNNVIVWSFGDSRPLRTGARNFVDNVILHESGYLWFIEIKMENTRDKLSPGQRLTRELLRKTEQLSSIVRYRLVNEYNYEDVIQEINNITASNLI